MQSPFARFQPARSPVPRITLYALGVLFAIVHTITGWYWIPAFVSGNFSGWYWPLLFYTQAVEPVMILGVIIGAVLLGVVLINRARGRPNPGRRRWGIGLIFAALFLGLTGLPAVFTPLSHDASTTVNQSTYQLATHHDLGASRLLLFECDLPGLACQKVYTSKNYPPDAIDSASLIPDVTRGTITVKVCLRAAGSPAAVSCDSVETYQQNLFK